MKYIFVFKTRVLNCQGKPFTAVEPGASINGLSVYPNSGKFLYF